MLFRHANGTVWFDGIYSNDFYFKFQAFFGFGQAYLITGIPVAN